MGKKAVVLFNLGGPDKLESVKPFLFNLFNDPNIISLPNPFRKWLAHFISSKREKTAQEIYQFIGGKSPLLELTNQQAEELEEYLETKDPMNEYGVYVCMRYWHPMTKEIVKQVKDFNPDEIILMPLYPQFSTTTSGSSFQAWEEEAKAQSLDIPTRTFCCYPTEASFIQAQSDLLLKAIQQVPQGQKARILFSAHGLPEKIIQKGDPYQWQVEQTAQAIVENLPIAVQDWLVSYQSKVGPMKWITPSTEAEIKRAGDEKMGLIILPVAFVSDHSETLVELDIEYRELAEEHGVSYYSRVPSLGIHEKYIQSLGEMCLNKGKAGKTCSNFNSRVCPSEFGRCPNNFYSE